MGFDLIWKETGKLQQYLPPRCKFAPSIFAERPVLTLPSFEGQEKKMILIVVEVTKLQRLRQMFRETDPEGFLIITEASEMLGRGN